MPLDIVLSMKRIDLSKYQPQVATLLREFMTEHKVRQQKLADIIGIQRSHLNAIINGGRKLSALYMMFILQSEVILKNYIELDPDMPEDEQAFWNKFS